MHTKPGRVSHQMMAVPMLHSCITPLPSSLCLYPLSSIPPSVPPLLLCLASKLSTPTRHSSAVAASSTTASSMGGTHHPPPPPTSLTLMHSQERHRVALTAFCTRYSDCWNVTEWTSKIGPIRKLHLVPRLPLLSFSLSSLLSPPPG